MQWARQTTVDFKTFRERSLHQFRHHEVGCASPVRFRLKACRSFVWAPFHDSSVSALQKSEEFGGAARETRHFVLVGDHLPCAQHVLSILASCFRYAALEHNVRGVMDGELRALDKVRVISVGKWKCGAVRGTLRASH